MKSVEFVLCFSNYNAEIKNTFKNSMLYLFLVRSIAYGVKILDTFKSDVYQVRIVLLASCLG